MRGVGCPHFPFFRGGVVWPTSQSARESTLMINKDYILRIAEKFGRFLAIILRLRQANQHEEALIFIDDLFFQSLGLTSSFISSLSEEALLRMISPLGALNIEKCLWIAALLKVEADIYADQGNDNESYHRYLKSLYLFLEVPPDENPISDLDIPAQIDEILGKLEEYELPLKMKSKLFSYYDNTGSYAKAEDILFEIIEADSSDHKIVEQGIAFYTRLKGKSDAELLSGNLSREEVEEGLAQLKQ